MKRFAPLKFQFIWGIKSNFQKNWENTTRAFGDYYSLYLREKLTVSQVYTVKNY